MLLAKPSIVGGCANSTAAWHALHTRYQHEKAIALVLANKGFEVFLPLYAATHQWKVRPRNEDGASTAGVWQPGAFMGAESVRESGRKE